MDKGVLEQQICGTALITFVVRKIGPTIPPLWILQQTGKQNTGKFDL